MNAHTAFQLLAALPETLQAYLAERGGAYGIAPHELMMKMPPQVVDNPLEIFAFLRGKHISHLEPVSAGGDPAAMGNWIFEDGAPNVARGAETMGLHEHLAAQADAVADGLRIDFGVPDPGMPGYDARFREVFGSAPAGEGTGFDPVGEAIRAITEGGEGVREQAAQSLLLSLTEQGIPLGYGVVRGLRQAWPFLASIRWSQLLNDPRYRTATLARALKTFRDGGWKAIPRIVVMGFLIAGCKPLAYLAEALGLSAVSAVGVRWLASRHRWLPAGLAAALGRIASALEAAAAFLASVFTTVERVVDQVIEVCCQMVIRGARSMGHWVWGWFQRPFPA